MKQTLSDPPAIVRNETASVKALFQKNVIPSYGRFDLVLSHCLGSSLWDVAGRRYLDMGSGIAVCSLGHANPEIAQVLYDQGRKLVHVSNLYYTEPQGRMAESLVGLIGPGKVFFANSGAESNEGLFKLARKFGHDEGRFEIITAFNSFHGRTLAGIAATGQDKVKKGFEPIMPGFTHVPYNDLAAVEKAITPATAAILIEGIQGEGGITPATPEYLLGLRKLCNERKLLLLMDSVQCGHFRTGKFTSYQRILESVNDRHDFIPDGVSMAKSLGGGFPMGAFWVREPYADLLSPGTHGTTYGGTPLGCAVGLKVLEVIKRDRLDLNAREIGNSLIESLNRLQAKYPHVLASVRGVGLMIGFELAQSIRGLDSSKAYSLQFVNLLQEAGMIAIPSGTNVMRFLPSLNISRADAEEAISILTKVIEKVA
ncbi:MAG: aruC [Verrucomicrobiales bacterium]|nr:aruC [Verrucomicrobiales bacterium]